MLSYPYILFIDTETSGKPRDWDTPPEECDKWPYIVQVAWRIHTSDGKEVLARDFYIEARDYRIRKKSRQIHGISEEMANQLGVTRKEALKSLYRDLRRFKPLIVGHFVDLDLRMIRAGFRRAGLKNIVGEYTAFCTMRATSDYMQINERNYPQLGELYQILFRRPMKNEHNAAGDARAVSECFFELVRRNEIDDALIKRQARQFRSREKKHSKTGCGLPVLFMFLLFILTSLLW